MLGDSRPRFGSRDFVSKEQFFILLSLLLVKECANLIIGYGDFKVASLAEKEV